MKKRITLEEAIEGVKGLFAFEHEPTKGGSFYNEHDDGNVTFFINKAQYSRFEAIERLTEYFEDKIIVDGQCRIDNITLVWTTVHLEKRSENDGQ